MAKRDQDVETMQAEHRAYRLRQAALAPAFPRLPVVRSDGEVLESAQIGMTLREWYAGLAMQGLCADPKCDLSASEVASCAVVMADALLAVLEKTP